MSSIEEIDAELARLQAEISSVERMPRTIAERYAEVEAELREAEQVYRTYSLGVSAGHPAETAQLQRQAVIGACMVVGSAQLLMVERERIAAQGEGMSAGDKARKIDQLKAVIMRAAAQRELEVRKAEGDGFLPRLVHPELAVYKRSEVERLAR